MPEAELTLLPLVSVDLTASLDIRRPTEVRRPSQARATWMHANLALGNSNP